MTRSCALQALGEMASDSAAAEAIFLPLATNLPGQPVTTTYTDTNAVPNSPFFYRIGVGN